MIGKNNIYSQIAQRLGEFRPIGVTAPLTTEQSPVPSNVAPYEPRTDVTHDLATDKGGGILKEIRVAGNGTATPGFGDRVQIRYVAFFPNGRIFDMTKEGTLEFTLGRGDVIKGLDIGVASMTKGEVAVVHCRPEYAYGELGNPPRIEPDATLNFEIEICDWNSEDLSEEQDGSIRRHQLVQGIGYATPRPGATVDVHLIGRHEGRVFDKRNLTFALLDGNGNDHGVPKGVQQALLQFLKGETSVLTLAPTQAFGSEGSVHLEVPPNASVEYEVTLARFEKVGKIWDMDTADKLEQASLLKSRAADLFRAGQHTSAVKLYLKVVNYMGQETNVVDADLRQHCLDMKLAALLNVALCRLKLQEFCEAKEACDAALRIDLRNEKALYRRGQAHLAANDYELSLQDFNQVLAIDPSNKAASNQVIVCNCKMKAAREKEKQKYGNMFVKFSERDKPAS